MAKVYKIVGDDLSDGYHTFGELYDHRCLLWVNLCLATPERAYWRNGFDGWPLLGMETPAGQVSYHVPERLLELFKDRIKEGGPEWDGHVSIDVLHRLTKLARRAE